MLIQTRSIRRWIAAGLLFLAALVAMPGRALAAPPSPLAPASDKAGSIADLFWIVLAIAVVVFLIVEGLLIFAVIRYRKRPDPYGYDDPPEQVEGNASLEVMWTVVPAIIMIILFGLTWQNLNVLRNRPADAMVIQVEGGQWQWQFTYTDTQIKLNTAREGQKELVLPVGEPILFEITSKDVIHSLWIPELNGKMDAIPGRTNTMWFRVDKPGRYAGQCAEFCGLRHYNMLFEVVAVERDKFDAWMAQKVFEASQFKPVLTDVEFEILAEGDPLAGETVFQNLGCAACHSLDGTPLVGPTMLGLGQRAATRVPGMDAEQYIRESIQVPCDFVVPGFACVMPQNFGESLDEQGLADLIAYLLEQ